MRYLHLNLQKVGLRNNLTILRREFVKMCVMLIGTPDDDDEIFTFGVEKDYSLTSLFINSLETAHVNLCGDHFVDNFLPNLLFADLP